MNGLRYALTFIYDLSRFTWVDFLKNKSKVFEKFNIFKAYVETSIGSNIKAIRYDNGGEYIKLELLKHFSYNEIHI